MKKTKHWQNEDLTQIYFKSNNNSKQQHGTPQCPIYKLIKELVTERMNITPRPVWHS